MKQTDFFPLLLQVSRKYLYRLNDEIEAVNINQPQFAILNYLKQNGTCLPVEIAADLNLEKSSITRMVARLKEKELVVQIQSKDKREKRLTLTAKGKQVYEQSYSYIKDYEEKSLQGVSKEEMEITFKTLQKIFHNVPSWRDKK